MSSAQSPLLWVPPRTTTDVSFAGSIRSTIAHVYQEGPDGYKEEIANLDRCRQDALRGSAGSDTTGRDLLYKYFGQLELLELRFPEVRVPFPWKDAFTGKEISQLSLAYEKASVIFNIGATLSSLAAQQNRSSPEGLKRAFHNARCAAGMFSYINDNFLHAPSTDLSREVVKTLVTLMVAQATEIFVERLTEEKKSAALRARVSTQAASLYGGVIEDVRDQVQKGVFDRSWTWYVQAKHKYFVSLAQYQRSLADASSSKHGEALARLHVAETAAKEASRFAGSFAAAQQGMHSMTMLGTALTAHPTLATLPSDAGTALIDITKSHLSVCSEARIAAHKENDLIYHDAQPTEASLPAIERASVADPIPIQDVYGAPEVQKVVGPDIFVRLVPLSVHESASLYSEEKAKLVRTEGERCDIADSELAAALDHMGLPAALDKFRDVAGVQTGGPAGGGGSRLDAMAEPPGQVRQWADEVRSAAPPLESLSKDIDEARARCAREIDGATGELDAEHRACEQMRVRYGHLWEQSPSSGSTKGWRAELRNQREALEQAKASDRSVGDLWNDVRSDVAVLSDPHGEAVERLFAVAVAGGGGPDGNASQNLLDVDDVGTADEAEAGAMKVHIRAIEEGLNRLQGLKKERQGVFRDLKERIQTDDISQLLILNRKSSNIEPALFAAELEKFRPHSARLAAAVHHQGLTLKDVEEHYNALASGKRAKEVQERWRRATAKRKELVERLRRAKEGHDDVRAGLSKGVLFYRELEDAVGNVKHQIASFAKQRATERQDLASQADVRQRLEGRGGSEPASASTPAPAVQSLEQQVRSMDLGSSVRSPAPPPPPRPPVQTRTTSSGWQPPPSQSPTTPLSASTGPAYQSFPPPPPPQQYQSYPPKPAPPPPPPVSSPPVDPYAGLGSFGSQAFSPAPPAHHQQPQSPASYGPRTSLPPPPPPSSVPYQSPPPGRVPSGTYSAQPPPPPPSSAPYQQHQAGYRPTPPPPPPPQSAAPSWHPPPQHQPAYGSAPAPGHRYSGPLPPPPPPSQATQYGGPPPQSPYGYGYQPQAPTRQASGPPPPPPPPAPAQGQQPYYYQQPSHQQQQGYYR